MAIPTVYKSTDGNAPVLCGTRTSMVNVLRKCLVDGYGDKAAAGWTMPYINIDQTRACFRGNQANGTGSYLYVNAEAPTYPNLVRFTGYESMTVEPELAGQFPFGTFLDQKISISENATARPWVLIATDTWAYFFSYRSPTALPTTNTVVWDHINSVGVNFFFGDFDKIYPDDAYNCAFLQSHVDAQKSFGFAGYASDAALSYHCIARDSSGAPGEITCAISIAPPGAVNSCFGGKGAAYSGVSALLASKLIINNGAAYSIRGFLPGALAPLHSSPFENLSIHPLDGNDYLAVSFRARSTTGYSGEGTSSQILINIGPTP